MACTTILVGKNATYDGSTMIARNDDAPTGGFAAKKFTVFAARKEAGTYRSVLSHLEVALPGNALRCTAVPNAVPDKGLWAAGGVNEENIAMTATETITTNERVIGADPLVKYRPAGGGLPEQAGGIGEEDIVALVLPYIHSAREGVLRLGELLTRYGTYESNGIAFQDLDEIWWLESIGGHHWIARRVPDDAYVVMPNQLGIDRFDLADALGAGKNHLCSADLAGFIRENHLDLSLDGALSPRDAFGSHTDADFVYNTPRAWFIERFLNPHTYRWDGPEADYGPEAGNLPWCLVPEKKVTVEDLKYLLSAHYQGTPFDPYGVRGDAAQHGLYRPIGINRNNFLALIQLRPDRPAVCRAVEWLAFGSNVFNALVPFYANIGAAPAYLENTGADVSTDSFYWANRLIGALADAHYAKCLPHIEHYQFAVQSRGRALIAKYDRALGALSGAAGTALCEQANAEIADMLRAETQTTLNQVLYEASFYMKNAYARADN